MNELDQMVINDAPPVISKEQSFIFKMLTAALSDVPFHEDTASVKRYIAPGFPLHLAVHEVSAMFATPDEYTQPHLHEDHDEINIILSEKKLLYRIRLGSQVFTVSNNSGIWIPRGMLHAANVIKGSGYFVTIRID